MILVVAFALVVIAVRLTGGRLGALADIRLRWVPAGVGSLLAQIGIINVFPDAFPLPVMAALHLATYVPAILFVWVNRRVPGLWLIGLGGTCNLAAIVGNGGVMPSTPAAAHAAGQIVASDFANSAPSTGSPLWFLGDVFAWPAPLPLANVFSIGDVVLIVGAAVALWSACRVSNLPVPSLG